MRVGAACEPDRVRFAVVDRGIGIAPESMAGLFTPFCRVGAASGQRIQGTGLGLCLARHLVEAHGGRIWVESQPGQGTTVCLTIPT